MRTSWIAASLAAFAALAAGPGPSAAYAAGHRAAGHLPDLAAWSALTPEEQVSYQTLVSATPSDPLPADTCGAATYSRGRLPFTDSNSTTGLNDDVDLNATGLCAGGGPQFGGTGTGPDLIYKITPTVTCDLQIVLDPVTADMSLYVIADCAHPALSCLQVSDQNPGGGAETVTFTALAGTDLYVVADGYLGQGGDFDLTISETTSTGCRLGPPEPIFADGFESGTTSAWSSTVP